MSPRVAAKIQSWRRAGLFGPAVVRQQIGALEATIDQGWSAQVSGDLDELHELLTGMESA